MTVRYVDGSAGNNSWDGLAANFVSGTNGPKLSLTGAEDTPVAAGDLIHVRTTDANGVPIVYREMLTVDVSGTAGLPIEYRADVAGVIWPIGGVCRITGSDNDTTATRANGITAASKNYRTFTGFAIDLVTTNQIVLNTAGTNWIVQDCNFESQGTTANVFTLNGVFTTCTIQRCVFRPSRGTHLHILHTAVVDNSANVVENCTFEGSATRNIGIEKVGGITVRNNLFIGSPQHIRVTVALTVGQTITVNNCIFLTSPTVSLQGTVSGEIVENYNSFWGNAADRTNTATGANSVSYPPLFNPQLLLSGFRLPQLPIFGLSEWSPLRAIAGTGMSADDLYGITRPVADSSKSWGAIQFVASPVRNLPIFGGIAR